MQLAKIQMQSTVVQFGLNITKPVQQIEQPKAELNIRQEPAILEINQEPGILTIDSKKAWYNLGLRTPVQFSDDNFSFAKQQLMDAIARISQEGDRMGAIERGGDPIVELAAEKIGIVPTPLPGPSSVDEGVDVSYQAQKAEIRIERRGMKMNPVLHPPVFKYTPGKVEVYIRQRNSLQIDVVGLNVDRSM